MASEGQVKSHRRIINIFVLFFFNMALIAITLAIAEFYCRYTNEKEKTYSDLGSYAMCLPDDKLIFRLKPFFHNTISTPEYSFDVRIDKDGLRGPDLATEAGEFVILVVGDSLTFGVGVQEEDRLTEKLAEELRKVRPDLHVRVINAGIWLYTFDQQLLLLKEIIQKIHPKLIIHGVSWVHIRTLFGHHLTRNWSAQVVAVSNPGLIVLPDGTLRVRSDWLEQPPLGSQLVARVGRYFLNRNLTKSALDYQTLLDPGEQQNDWLWALTEDLLKQSAEAARAAGAAYIPYLTPANIQLSDRYLGGIERNPKWNMDYPNNRLAAIFRDAGVEPLDLLPVFRTNFNENLYYNKDPHWRAGGHALAAKALLPRVLAMLPAPREEGAN